ncbi:hypothetical protein GYA49_00080 [Candidatus Beckwithbacteria bacterium]|nr:hypothetical protein [Candidatus Beckwithbacteria bacterium]
MLPATLVTTQLIDRYQLSASCVELTLLLSKPVRFEPGQYLNLQLEQFRAYSVAWQASDLRTIKLCIDTSSAGIGSSFAATAPLGTKTPALMPMGKFLLSNKDMPTLFIATGVGIAPFRFMLSVLRSKQPITLIWGLRHDKDIFWQDDWEHLTKRLSHFSYQLCLSKENKNPYYYGRVTNWLKEQVNFSNHQVYICGNRAMIDEVKQILIAKQIAEDNIYTEKLN